MIEVYFKGMIDGGADAIDRINETPDGTEAGADRAAVLQRRREECLSDRRSPDHRLTLG